MKEYLFSLWLLVLMIGITMFPFALIVWEIKTLFNT